MSETTKAQKVAEILNGEKQPYVRCAVELGYDAGYRQALEDTAKVACNFNAEHVSIGKGAAVAAAIRALGERGL